MGQGQCRRFEALLDRALLDGAPHNDEEASFLEQHGRGCPDCSLSAGLLEEMERLGETSPVEELGDAALEMKAREILARNRQPARAPIHRRLVLATSLAVALAALLLLVLRAGRPEEPPAAMAGATHQEVTVAQVSGQASFLDRGATAGDRLRAGDSLQVERGSLFVEIEGGSTVFVERESQIALVAASADAVRFGIERGLVAFHVAPLGAEQSFAVDTPGGRITVLGTVFSVSVAGDGQEISVAEGLVRLEPAHGPSLEIPAGRVLHTVEGMRELAATERQAIERMALLGEHPSVPAVGDSAQEEPAADTASPAPEPPPPASRASAGPPAEPSPAPPSMETLLSSAREARALGDYAGAVDAYRELMEAHPGSPEARTCLVLVGRIQLEKLDRPDLALAAFERYLEVAELGSLAEEAEWSIAVSLGRLGRNQDEHRALLRFQDHHPDGLYAHQAAARLEQLEK